MLQDVVSSCLIEGNCCNVLTPVVLGEVGEEEFTPSTLLNKNKTSLAKTIEAKSKCNAIIEQDIV